MKGDAAAPLSPLPLFPFHAAQRGREAASPAAPRYGLPELGGKGLGMWGSP